jgi:hypothetical protein
MKLGSNSVEDHPQPSHNRHPVDGALVGAGSLWPLFCRFFLNLTVCMTKLRVLVLCFSYFMENSISFGFSKKASKNRSFPQNKT